MGFKEIKIEWPDNKKFGLVLTHDVDRVKKTYQYLTHFLKTGRFYHIKSLVSEHNPYWTFGEIMKVEEGLGVRSTFFFLNESIKFNPFYLSQYKLSLGRYKINEKDVTKIINELDSKGWEIGLHGSYNSYQSIDLLEREKNMLESVLGKPVFGIRQHYLNLDVPLTWQYHEKLGFQYDSSFGFKNQLGFRDNVRYPFQPFNSKFTVIPLSIMDMVIFNQKGLTDEQRFETCREIINSAIGSRAMICVVWHTERFNNKEFPGQTDFYMRLVNECINKGAYVSTAKEVIKLISIQKGEHD
ncbi:MAG: polysaccharide deacetylase family protein [Methanobacteriota archaeon]